MGCVAGMVLLTEVCGVPDVMTCLSLCICCPGAGDMLALLSRWDCTTGRAQYHHLCAAPRRFGRRKVAAALCGIMSSWSILFCAVARVQLIG
jgi:hypothetical protein